MCFRSFIALAVAALCPAANAAGAVLDRPVTVSPGGSTNVATTPALCPTFSWGSVAGAQSYEIVVYEMSAGGTAAPPGQVATLEVAVPGSASSWTPSADGCLESATAYVWFVRALGSRGTVSDWSEGGMFRTPRSVPPADLEELITRIVRRQFEAPGAASSGAGQTPFGPTLRRAAAVRVSSTSPGTRTSPPGIPPVTPAFQAEMRNTPGVLTYGVYGISDSTEDDSSGVVGYADAASGAVNGVAGFARSPEGRGVFAENSAPSGGIAILAQDGPASSTELSAAIVGFTENSNGFGGFFSNRVGGIALAVADVDADVIKFSVDHLGRVEVAEVVRFAKTDSPPACNASLEGAIYYDDSENWLCICAETAPTPAYGWRRADDKTDDCST